MECRNVSVIVMSCAPAAKSRATCRHCEGDDCRNNILDDIIAEGVLTSGYFSIAPVGATKPQGRKTDLENDRHELYFDKSNIIDLWLLWAENSIKNAYWK